MLDGYLLKRLKGFYIILSLRSVWFNQEFLGNWGLPFVAQTMRRFEQM